MKRRLPDLLMRALYSINIPSSVYLHWSEHEVQLHVPFETISKYITLQATLSAVINTTLMKLIDVDGTTSANCGDVDRGATRGGVLV